MAFDFLVLSPTHQCIASVTCFVFVGIELQSELQPRRCLEILSAVVKI
jgi:hypothetical protein